MGARIGVVGASGYSGAELLRLLAAHEEAELLVATSREFAGLRIADVYPNLSSYGSRSYEELGDPARLETLDLVFLALPHGAAASLGAHLAAAGTRVVDFSGDFRLRDGGAYPSWYGTAHPAPEWIGRFVYGLPELYRTDIRASRLVANPGCYPTAALLALAPLVRAGAVEHQSIVVSAASGVSGAGRGLGSTVHFSHADANVKAYGLPVHKHTPEIEQELTALAGEEVRITFVPHLVPMVRGLLATCVARLADGVTRDDLARIATDSYENEPFVRVVDGLPETKYSAGSNLCLVGYETDPRTRRVVAVAALDNLGKGAAGQALQNANLMLGIPEGTGLGGGGVYP